MIPSAKISDLKSLSERSKYDTVFVLAIPEGTELDKNGFYHNVVYLIVIQNKIHAIKEEPGFWLDAYWKNKVKSIKSFKS